MILRIRYTSFLGFEPLDFTGGGVSEGFESRWPVLKAWAVMEDRSWAGIKDRLPAEIIGVVKISCMLVTG